MPTKIYDSANIELIDGTQIYITPLKLKYLREFMDSFGSVSAANDEDDALSNLSRCMLICMKQYYPSIKTIEHLEDSVDMPTFYKILEVGAGISMKKDEESEESIKEQATKESSSWEDMDLAKLETEVFLLGMYKDYEELEVSLSLPELSAILNTKREMDFEEKKFLASIQGIDLEGGAEEEGPKENAWEAMKARVFSGGKAQGAGDILAYQGINASQAGFGIGMGLDYEDLTKK
jgi:hypothetical protein